MIILINLLLLIGIGILVIILIKDKKQLLKQLQCANDCIYNKQARINQLKNDLDVLNDKISIKDKKIVKNAFKKIVAYNIKNIKNIKNKKK